MFLNDFKKTALIYNDDHVSYIQLLDKTDQFANMLAASCKKIAIFSENRPEWIYAFYGAWKKNVVCVPIDFMASPDEISYILNDCKPETIFYSEKTKEILLQALEKTQYTPETLQFESLKTSSIEKKSQNNIVFEIDNLERVSTIIYTSGTTGSPKGVMLTYDNILANVEAVRDAGYFTEKMTTMILLPLHHIFPLMGSMISTLFVGGTCAFSPSIASEDIVATLQKHKVTMIIGVPRFYDLIRKGIKAKIEKKKIAQLLFFLTSIIKSKKLSKIIFKSVHKHLGGHIKFLISGGAKLNSAVAYDFQTLGFEICEGFGMTEAAPMITFPRLNKIKIGSTGQELRNDTVRISNGEIIARGRNIMKGYYNRPDETADTIKKGWLHTGDTGYFDKDGFLFITGRIKEIIVLPNGKNINPVEIETKISEMSPLVNEIAVFLNNSILHALIVPAFDVVNKQRDHDLDDLFKWEVIDAYNKQVSPAKKILNYTIINTPLPRTRLQKVQRFKLHELVNASHRRSSGILEPDTAEYKSIKNFIEDITNESIHSDDHFEIDLGIDSLDMVRLQEFIKNTFGVELQDAQLFEYQTAGKISEYVKKVKTKFEQSTTNWSEMLNKRTKLFISEPSIMLPVLKTTGSFFSELYFRIKSTGGDKLPDNPFIFAANHQSFLDGMLLAKFLNKGVMNNTYFFAKEKHFQQKWRRFLAKRNNIIIMGFEDNLIVSLKKMAEALKQGKNIIIFPEGTRTRDGLPGKFKNMFAILSVELGVPVVPVAISGSYNSFPRSSLFPIPFSEIKVDFLPAVSPEDHTFESMSSTVRNKICACLNIPEDKETS